MCLVSVVIEHLPGVEFLHSDLADPALAVTDYVLQLRPTNAAHLL
jgi:hypothetical protein